MSDEVLTRADGTDPTVAVPSATSGKGKVSVPWIIPPVLTILLMALAPLILSSYWMFLATTLFAYVIALLGLKVLFGDCGQLSLAQASFVAIGAYTAAISRQSLHLTLPYELLLVIVVSGLVAAFLALAALRVYGLRFALVTLAFGEIVQRFLREGRSITGGEQGLFVPAPLLGSVDTQSPLFMYVFSALLALVVTVIVWHLPKTRVGRAMSAVRESEIAAVSVGVSIKRTKLFAFILAAVFGGISGLLIAHVSGSISPTTFSLFPSIYLIVALIVGGRRSTIGSWIGAVYLVLVPAFFTTVNLDGLYVVLSGAVLLVVVMVFPSGIAGVFTSVFDRRDRNLVVSSP